MKNSNNWQFVENTMYGFKKAKIFKNKITGRIKIEFYTSKDSFLFTNYYNRIPNYIFGRTV